MRSAKLFYVLCTALAMAAFGCDKPTSPEPEGRGAAVINVSSSALSAADITRLVITVSGDNISPDIMMTLPENPENHWSGTIQDIPAGYDRTFLAEAFDSTDTLIFSGTAVGVTIMNGETASVSIFLQEMNPPAPFGNAVPVITSFVASALQVETGGTITFAVAATDANPEDALDYAWSATGGSFGNSALPTTVWTAPAGPGVYQITASVSDPHGATATVTASIEVGEIPPTGVGAAAINITINTSPTVLNLVPSPTRIDAGELTQLNLTAVDQENNPLSHTWSSDCSGYFNDIHLEDPTFTLNQVTQDFCTLTVAISDGVGGSNQASITIETGESVVLVGPDGGCDGGDCDDGGIPTLICGNGVVELGETCDPVSSCPTSCNDGNACTVDQMTGSAANCDVACSYTSITTCASDDGCCPDGCDDNSDSDCTPIILPFVAGELLGRPTDQSVTVNVMADQAMEAYFEYGTAPSVYVGGTTPTDFFDGVIETVIDGLSPDTRYYYRMRYRPTGSVAEFLAGSEYTFQTQRSLTSTFTFAVQSDSHQGYASFYNDELYRITMGNILGDVLGAQPDFMIDLGDAVSTDDTTETEDSVSRKYLNQRTVLDLAVHSIPIFLVLGNHENEEGWNLDDMGTSLESSLPVLGANARKHYFLNPVPDSFYTGNLDPLAEIDDDHLREDYYAFEWGNALFVVIDPFWYTMKKPYSGTTGGEKDDETVGDRWDWTLGIEQYDWLKQTLESSTAKFKFVFSHHTTDGDSDYIRSGSLAAKYCEWGGYNTDGVTWAFESHRPGWEMPIHQLFIHTGVTAFFHGHDHVFAEEVMDGIVYQEVPHAANADYGMGFSSNPTDYANATLVANSGYVRVTVTPTTATAEYVRSYLPGDGANGEVSYAYEMVPCDARDTDGDGTIDCSDGCPSDPSKIEPGLCRCGTPDTDSDSDGTADCDDGCPTDPLKVDPGDCGCGQVDSEGCCEEGRCLPPTFMAVRVGSGTETLSTTSTAAFIEEHDFYDGTLINTITLPTAVEGANQPLTLSGSAYVEGALKRSVDEHYVTVAGYAVGTGMTKVAQTATTTVNRVVGRVSSDYTVDTTTRLTAAFSGTSGNNANPRGVITYDGSAFWVVGAGTSNTGGVWYVPFGTTTATQITGQSGNDPTSVRTCDIFNDQLYAATNSSPFFGVFSVGEGLPTTQATAEILPGFPTSGSSSPVDFAVLDRDPGIAGADTIYLSDDRAVADGGGVEKWTFDGTTWTRAYTLNTGLTTGVRHLLAVELPSRVYLLAVTTSTPNSIVKVVDSGSGSSATAVVTAGTNTAFRGVALSPVP